MPEAPKMRGSRKSGAPMSRCRPCFLQPDLWPGITSCYAVMRELPAFRSSHQAILLLCCSVLARLGSYEILAPISAGGMGEVYKAHEAKLGREVTMAGGNVPLESRSSKSSSTASWPPSINVGQFIGDVPREHQPACSHIGKVLILCSSGDGRQLTPSANQLHIE